jgi:hypothetical protein
MPSGPEIEAASAELHRAIMGAFCKVLQASRLPPMTVMSLTAAAVGSIYKEVADEHRNNACPCGWYPNPSTNVQTLQTALTTAAHTISFSDPHIVQVAGRA